MQRPKDIIVTSLRQLDGGGRGRRGDGGGVTEEGRGRRGEGGGATEEGGAKEEGRTSYYLTLLLDSYHDKYIIDCIVHLVCRLIQDMIFNLPARDLFKNIFSTL